jgi:prephenate dehydrogenase/chorismate mutase
VSGKEELDELRREVKDVTGSIIRSIAYRNSLASRIAYIKASESLPLADGRVEEDLREFVLRTCREEGVSESAGEEALKCLLEESKRVQAPLLSQEGNGSGAVAHPSFKEVAVIGCSGGMGSLLVRHFILQGSSVRGADPRRPTFSHPRFSYFRSNSEAVAGADLVAIASPLECTGDVIERLLADLPKGCVLVEVSSVKGALEKTLKRIGKRGKMKVLSLHPLFGPSVARLKGVTILLVPVEDVNEELRLAKRAFPEADFMVLSGRDHDMAMALSLSLTHVANLAFCRTLIKYTTPSDFRRVAAPFAVLQLSVGEGILLQDPHLYSQIQMKNRFSRLVVESFAREAEELDQIVEGGNRRRYERLFSELARSYGPDAQGRRLMGALYRAGEQVKTSTGGRGSPMKPPMAGRQSR